MSDGPEIGVRFLESITVPISGMYVMDLRWC